MVDHDVRRILAVLDWEMATLGDPLADLGLLVVYSELAASGLAPTPDPARARSGASCPRPSWCAATPTHAGTPEPDRIGWYTALGYYKLAIISEGIHARFLQGKTVGAGFERMGERVPDLVDRASSHLRAS